MKGRSLISKRCSCGAGFQPQFVLHRVTAGAVLSRVDQHVRADLGKSCLEQDEVAIVGTSAGALAQQGHRVVKGVQSFFQPSECGVKFKRGKSDCANGVGVRSQ